MVARYLQGTISPDGNSITNVSVDFWGEFRSQTMQGLSMAIENVSQWQENIDFNPNGASFRLEQSRQRLMLSIYGIKELWAIITKKFPMPEAIGMLFQAIVLIISVIMFIPLMSYLPKLAQYCSAVKYLPYVTIAIVVLVLLYRCFTDKFKTVLKQTAVLSVMILIVFSNQYSLAPLLGDGQQDIEFKYLADWYIENAKPGEKMAVYMAGTVGVFAPEFNQYFVGPPAAENPQDFYKKCKGEDITYIVWASREGLSQDHYDYHRLNLDKNINFLLNAKDIGPYRFITQIRSPRGYLNIFRLN